MNDNELLLQMPNFCALIFCEIDIRSAKNIIIFFTVADEILNVVYAPIKNEPRLRNKKAIT